MVKLVLYQVIFHYLLQLQPILYPAIFSLSLSLSFFLSLSLYCILVFVFCRCDCRRSLYLSYLHIMYFKKKRFLGDDKNDVLEFIQ